MRIALLVLLPILVACGGASSDEGIVVRFAPEVGSEWRQWTVTEQDITQELSGTSSTVRLSIGIGTTYRIVGVGSDGSVMMEALWDSIEYHQRVGGADVSWSSADTSTAVPDMAIGYAAMVGGRVFIRLGPTGNVIGIEGGDALRNRLSEGLAERGELGGYVDRTVRATLADSALVASLTDLFSFYPTDRVDLNDSWSRAGKVVSIASLQVDYRFRVATRKDGHITLAVEGTMETTADDPLIEIGDIGVRYDMEGEMRGEMEVDERSGWMLQGTRTQRLEGVIRSFVGKERKEGVDIPIAVTGTVTTTTKRVPTHMPTNK